MKIVIEMSEDVLTMVKKEVKNNKNASFAEFIIANGTPIPDNATVCDIEQIRAEIETIEINGQVDEHTMFIRSGEQVKQMALDIIDKYTKGE